MSDQPKKGGQAPDPSGYHLGEAEGPKETADGSVGGIGKPSGPVTEGTPSAP